MMEAFSLPDFSILVDEVGIRIGVHGDMRLRTAFQPVFASGATGLDLHGLRAFVRPSLPRHTVSPASYFQGIAPTHKDRVNTLVARLHSENRSNAGVAEPETLDLFLGVDASSGLVPALAQIDAATAVLGDERRHLVCEIMRSDAIPGGTLVALRHETRARGVRLALDSIGADGSALRYEADVLKMRGQLYRNLLQTPQVVRLVRPLVASCGDAGAKMLVEGIETSRQLDVALEAGAALVQGYLLGLPALAGTIIDDASFAIAHSAGEPERLAVS